MNHRAQLRWFFIMSLDTPNSTYRFQETQRLKRVWIWIWLLTNLVLLGVLRYYWHKTTNYDSSLPQLVWAIIFVPLVGVFLLLFFAKLETVVDGEGIQYKFVPLHRSKVSISWDDIAKAYVRKYRPIFEYGGWGIRPGIFGRGRAYNVSGNMGLQLVFNNGRKLLLGTKRPEEINNVLSKLAEAGIAAGKIKKSDRF